jgi:hypothetical protein
VTEVVETGPLFDGRLAADLTRACDEAADLIAQTGHDEVEAYLGTHLKHPTGYYESRVRVDRQQDDRVIDDGGVVYGPWLEGVGSRNFPRTRFRGYRTFRTVTQTLDREAGRITEEVISQHIREEGLCRSTLARYRTCSTWCRARCWLPGTSVRQPPQSQRQPRLTI